MYSQDGQPSLRFTRTGLSDHCFIHHTVFTHRSEPATGAADGGRSCLRLPVIPTFNNKPRRTNVDTATVGLLFQAWFVYSNSGAQAAAAAMAAAKCLQQSSQTAKTLEPLPASSLITLLTFIRGVFIVAKPQVHIRSEGPGLRSAGNPVSSAIATPPKAPAGNGKLLRTQCLTGGIVISFTDAA